MSPGRQDQPFAKAARFVMDVLEGGDSYTNDPNDAGGATKYGISRRAYPNIDIATLTRDQALDIYYRDYWLAVRADALSPELGMMVFASAVNLGVSGAVRCLQSALSVTVDGKIGPITLRAANEYRPRAELRAGFQRACIEYYLQLVHKHPYNKRWLHGWIGRVCRVAEGHRWDGTL